MINILPPESKAELKFSHRNAKLLKYFLMVGVVGGLMGALLGLSLVYADRQINHYQTTLTAKRHELQNYGEIKQNVEQLQSNLELVSKLLNERTHYSELLSDLAASLPADAYITHLQLTGDEKKPVEMLVTTNSFNQAAEVRNGLVATERIKSADIQSVTKNEKDNNFTVTLIVAFEPGGAR